MLDQQTRRVEAAEARADCEREAARAQRMRDAMHERIEIAAHYADAFRSFGSEPPMAVDDESPARYRARLFNRLVRRLAPDHRLAKLRADDLSGYPLDHFESELIKAAQQEGASPSEANLPDDGIIMRTRTDSNTGGKFNEFYGKTSFIRDMSRPGRRVVAVIDRNTGQAIWGRPFPVAR